MNTTIFLIAIWFFLLYFLFFKQFKTNDFFAPISLISLIYLFRNVPYILFVAFDEDFLNPYLLNYFKIYNPISIESAFLKYTIIQTIAFLCLIAGMKYMLNDKTNYKLKPFKFKYRPLKISVYIAFFVGLSSFLIFVSEIGGILYLLENMNQRIQIQSGQYLLQLRPLMGIATVFSVVLIKLGGNKTIDKIAFILFFIISVFVFSSTGGRKDSVFLIMLSIGAYYYYLKDDRINFFDQTRLILISLGIFFYIFFIPLIRSTDGFNNLLKGDLNLIEEANISDFFSNISYTYIDVFTVNHFNNENRWNFASLMTIPSNIFDRKEAYLRPPIDEGMYFVSSIVWGGNYKPLVARSQLREFSFPIENMGFSYANALLPGVVIFFFLLGIILAYIYKLFRISSFNPFLFYLYLFAVFNFNFSSLRLITMVVFLILLGIFSLIYRFIKNLS